MNPEQDVANHMSDVLGPDGMAPLLVSLSSAGSLEERARSDEALWQNIEPNRLYAFAGTRVMAVTVSEPERAYIFVGQGNGHGTPTASLVARGAPEAIILMVVQQPEYCPAYVRPECYIDPSTSRAMAWLSQTSAVDVISVSLAVLANEPSSFALHPEGKMYLDGSRAASARGALVVNGAGNSPTPVLASYFAGPPWVVAVGGFEPKPQGESVLASKLPDVVANFTETVAIASSLNDTAWASGTSFGTPIVAGTLAAALHEIRRALGHAGGITPDGALAVGRTPDGRALRVTSETLRDALNASAMYVDATSWDPTNASAPFDPLLFWTRTSIPILAPPAQMGWGYVHAGLAHEIARRVLDEDTTVPPDKAGAAAFRAGVQAAREAYWDHWPE